MPGGARPRGLRAGRIGDPAAAPHLVRAAAVEDPALHRAAVTALGELGEVAVDMLVAELRSVDPADRVRAVLALGETRAFSAVEPLMACLRDEDATVRARARESIEKIRESRVF
ncbi:MAG TPA: HEAT repeat domain-containing protein [Actinomycetota bacterium]|jgi:HEAT repeat protein|nr:HEAT repeat domain-containing protein [Actinomycetota bacterium]